MSIILLGLTLSPVLASRQKKFHFRPTVSDLLLAFSSGTPEGQNTPPLAGTLYAGGARDHEEVVFGLGGSAYNLELLGQYRRYWNQDCRGVFAGFYGSVLDFIL